MATVEQCETQPSGLKTLSTTLELFNGYKPLREEDKDSDEESFHLPMLDCDDDLESNNKEAITSVADKDTHGETEDDILNKFETTATPDLDPKIEESILEDIEELCEKKPSEKSTEINGLDNETSQMEECADNKDIDTSKKDEEISISTEESEKDKPKVNNITTDSAEIGEPLGEVKGKIEQNIVCEKEKEVVEQGKEMFVDEKMKAEDDKKVEQDHKDESKQVNKDLNESSNERTEMEECAKIIEEMDTKLVEGGGEVPVEDNIKAIDTKEEIGVNAGSDSTIVEELSQIIEMTKDKKILNTEAKDETGQESMLVTNNAEAVEEKQQQTVEASTNELEKMDVDSVEPETVHSEINTSLEKVESVPNESEDNVRNNDQTVIEDKSEAMEVEIPDSDKKEDSAKKEEDSTKKEEDSTKMEEDSDKKEDSAKKEEDSTKMEADSAKKEEGNTKKEEDSTKKEGDSDKKEDDCDKKDSIRASENIESAEIKDTNDKESVSTEVLVEDKLNKNSTLCEIIEENKSLQVCSNEVNEKISDTEKPLTEPAKLDESVKEKDTLVADDSKTEKIEPDKCENSNDSSKSQNLECDDLLDISIIRDADEDNASAIAENAIDGHSSEKSDNDDQDDSSEKAENELDESEMDQEESLTITDKDDNMDFEDGNSSNLCDQDNTTSGNTSDSENKDDGDMRDSENDSKDSGSVLKEKTNKTDNKLNSEKIQTDKLKDVTRKMEVVENQGPLKENLKVSGKRSLSETDKDSEVINKKIKLSEQKSTEEKKSAPRNNKVKTLITFEKYMQNKKLKDKLSRSDLEQFCLQKICETIMHKTDVGELHQTIKKQEVIIENLRKDLQQLTKQTRDLDIVNKKLMNELRAQNGNKKPLVPLKITRSVGLQVKLNLSTENNRRKMPVTTTTRTPNTPNTYTRPRTIAPANAGVVRQVAAASPRKTPTSTPLLSQALQNRQASPANTAKRTPIRPKPSETQKPASQSVIDLTDEDDKAAKTAAGTPVKVINKTVPMTQAKTINIVPAKTVPTKTVPTKTVPNKTVNTNQSKTVAVGQVKTTTVGAKIGTPARTVTALPQGVRLTPTQVKNGSITIPASVVTSNSGTTQLMYVVQPTGGVVTSTAGGAQKAVLLNFQPTNGVLTSALNGSAVSVIPTKPTNTVQLKTVASPRKHPAPLPTPPSSVAVNAALKPLLPKPHLSIRKTDTGIILQWRMPYNLEIYEGIASYQLFAYQETNAAPSTDMWRKVGDVKALALPMACTLTQFADKNKYYFAVRSVDVHKRIGAFSDPEEISL